MGYTINLIQEVATGGLWNGNRFNEILTQNDYTEAQFITGDPESIPNNFAGLSPGEYRVMTFLTYGDPSSTFPMINGNPFSNFAGQPAANAVDVTFTGGSAVTLNPQAPFDEVANFEVGMYLFFTEQQLGDNSLSGVNGPGFFGLPEYNGLFWMQLFYDSRRGQYSVSGFEFGGPTGPISAQYLIVY